MIVSVAVTVVAAYIGVALIVHTANPTDFTPFYCAGAALRLHEDPYTAQALMLCEHRVTHDGVYVVSNVVLPAPLPPYTLQLFALLSLLPYDVAARLWRLALLLAVAVAAISLRRLTGLRWSVIVLTLLPIDLIVGMSIGQVVPVVVAAVAWSAWALQRGKDRLAAVVICGTMIEPHIGLTACVALFVYRRGARLPLAASAVAIGAFSCLTTSFGLNVEYLLRVLPAQADAELSSFTQFSLAHILFVLGVVRIHALQIGALSYLVVACISIFIAGAIARHHKAHALLIAFPAALSMFGGNSVHVVQLAATLPAALLMTAYTEGRARVAAATATLLLAIPGPPLSITLILVLFTIVASALAANLYGRWFYGFMAGGIVLLFGVLFRDVPLAMNTATRIQASVDQHELAAQPWKDFLLASDPGPVAQRLALLADLPTIAGLIVLLTLGAFLASDRLSPNLRPGRLAWEPVRSDG